MEKFELQIVNEVGSLPMHCLDWKTIIEVMEALDQRKDVEVSLFCGGDKPFIVRRSLWSVNDRFRLHHYHLHRDKESKGVHDKLIVSLAFLTCRINLREIKHGLQYALSKLPLSTEQTRLIEESISTVNSWNELNQIDQMI